MTSKVGSDVAVFGAIAPFENVVVPRLGAVDWRGGKVVVSTFASAVSATVGAGALRPAAESTHAFMFVRLIRLALSARALATVAGDFGFPVSTAAFRGVATYVVNCAGSIAGISNAAAERTKTVVAECSFTGNLRVIISIGGIARARWRHSSCPAADHRESSALSFLRGQVRMMASPIFPSAS